jgi:hypothetical protein
MIMGRSEQIAPKTTHDHEHELVPSHHPRQNQEQGDKRACEQPRVWQTDSVTFGRIIIGWRVGT